MDERLRLVARLLDGETMSEVCRSFGISRKTGYKIFNRYREHGLEALTDRSRRPWRYANQLPEAVETLIVRAKREKPHWGARKIRELLVKRLAGDVRIPAKSTVHAVLDRHGLVKRAKTRRNKAMGTTCNLSTTRSAQGCYPCLRYVPLPMSPGRTILVWCRRRDLNPRPTHYECVALPLSYCGYCLSFHGVAGPVRRRLPF
jgi:transposase